MAALVPSARGTAVEVGTALVSHVAKEIDETITSTKRKAGDWDREVVDLVMGGKRIIQEGLDDQRGANCARSLKAGDRSMPSICLTASSDPSLPNCWCSKSRRPGSARAGQLTSRNDVSRHGSRLRNPICSVYFRNQVATSEWASMILPFNDAEPGSLVEQSGRRSVPPARN
jgi:hypothetical protein